jgi:hypothetical protein
MRVARKILPVAAVLLSLAHVASALETVPEVAPPKFWDKFTILVWQFNTNVLKDKSLYESVNMRGFHIDRKNEPLQAFAKETKWPFYVDHAASKGYLHLTEAVRNGFKGNKGIVARPNSLADPKTIEAMKQHLQANVTSAKGSSAVAYAFDDEISTATFSSAVEVDGSPLSVAGYQKALEAVYGKIETLNAQYGSSNKDFASVQPQSFEAFRAQLKSGAIGKLNLSQWCDWHSHMDTQFADCLAELTKYTNGLDPATPAGFVGAQGPTAFGGYDFRKLCKAVQSSAVDGSL